VSAELIEGSMEDTLRRFRDHQFDAALAIESLYVSHSMPECIAQLTRVTKPGGLVFVTHRTRYYYILQCLSQRRFDDALLVATESEGRLRKSYHRVYYRWESQAQIRELYADAGLKIVAWHAVGPYSGFEPDAMRAVCDPATLSSRQREQLLTLELHHSDPETLMACRYVLVCARRP
jgi:ubiquinone/menaquinone biosynthesis C-methylase UbiE